MPTHPNEGKGVLSKHRMADLKAKGGDAYKRTKADPKWSSVGTVKETRLKTHKIKSTPSRW